MKILLRDRVYSDFLAFVVELVHQSVIVVLVR